jgi:hypothetical protein
MGTAGKRGGRKRREPGGNEAQHAVKRDNRKRQAAGKNRGPKGRRDSRKRG